MRPLPEAPLQAKTLPLFPPSFRKAVRLLYIAETLDTPHDSVALLPSRNGDHQGAQGCLTRNENLVESVEIGGWRLGFFQRVNNFSRANLNKPQ